MGSSTTALPFALAEQRGAGPTASEQASQRSPLRDTDGLGEGRKGGEKLALLVFREGFDLIENGGRGLAHDDANAVE